MKASAVICDARQQFSLEEVNVPEPSKGQIVVRAVCSAISIGTEFALIRNKISWGPYPLCTGYMASGVIEQVGSEVSRFRIGDRVYYRGNAPMQLRDGSPISSVSGTHCSLAVFDPDTTHGAALVPEGLGMDLAATFVLPAVGLNGVDMAALRVGELVLVYGVGQVGLAVVAAAALRGCEVVAVDLDDRRLEIARRLGADHLINGRCDDAAACLKRLRPETSAADVVFECTGLPQCLDAAIALCRPHGRFVWQGNYGAQPVSLSFLPAHGRRLSMHFPCDDGYQPCRSAVVKWMARGTLAWNVCISHRIKAQEAPAMFHRINTGQLPDALCVVIDWT